MPAEHRSSDPADPLAGYSGLSLFPRTLASLSNPPRPYDKDDLRDAHNFLKSMPLRSPNKLLEQAKVIVNRSSGLSMSEIISYRTSKHENEVAAKVIDNPQERRPALGRKRARFSLKPKSSQPPVNWEPSLEIDKLKDPEEFFLAFEKLENAKRELQKQTGGIFVDLNQQNPSMAARPRRPGILGRSVKYKHHYSSDMSSQETFEENILSQSDYNVQKETTSAHVASQERDQADAELQETELVGSVAKSGKRVNELLDELLSGNDEELDEDGAVTLLQEQLQIKPIDLEKLCLPDLQDVPRMDLKASGTGLPNPRNALSNITNLLKGMSSKTPKKRKSAESPIPCLASPTPPKNPLGSIISLKKRILESNSLIDPFSAHDIDQSHARNASPFGSIEKQMDEVNMEKKLSISPKLKSIVIEENGIANVNTSLPELPIGDVAHSSDKTMNNNLSRLGSGVDVGSSGFNADLEGIISGNGMDDKVGRLDADAYVQTNEPTEFNERMEDVLQEAVDSEHPDLNMENSTTKKLNSNQTKLDQTSCVVEENCIMDVYTNLPEVAVGDVTCSSDKTVNDNLSSHSGLDIGCSGFHADVEGSVAGCCIDNRVVSETLGRPDVDTDDQTNEPTEFSDKCSDKIRIEDVLREAVDSVQPDLNMENSAAEKLNSTQRELDETSREVVEDHAADGRSKTAETGPEQHDKEVQILTGEPFNEESKEVSRSHKKHERSSSRQSKRERASSRQSKGERASSRQSKGEGASSRQSLEADQTSCDVVEDQAMDGPSKTADTRPEQHDEEVQTSTKEPLNEQSKAISRARKKGKREGASGRQSLAASGTSWESGVRRSTRIRSRPLEYWKGERFLYGRIHQSLTTVIGIKYESPGSTDGKPAIKVKSFVSDDYKDLVELAARF